MISYVKILCTKVYLLFTIICATTIFLSADYSFGQTWDGSESADWNAAENWDSGIVPNGSNIVIITTVGVNFMPVISDDPTNTIEDITVQSGATLTQTGGTFICNKFLINGTFNQSGGTLLSDQDLKIEDGGVLNQSGTGVIQLDLLGTDPVKGIKFKEKTQPLGGGTGTQTGSAIIRCKDFKIESANSSFTQSGDGLIFLNNDWKNLGAFTSSGGTIQFGGVGGRPDFSTGTNQFFNVIIDEGANPKFDNDPNGLIKVAGNWTNNSSIASLTLNNTTVEFNGTSVQTIGGSEPTTFNSLTIINSSGDVNMSIDASVEGIFLFNNGKLNTGSNMLTLGTTPGFLLGESAGKYLVGNLTTTRVVGTGSSVLGNIGVSLGAGLDDLGSLTVTRISGPAGIISLNGNSGIARSWLISSTNPPINGRDITFSWVSDDDNAVELTNALIFASSDLGMSWAAVDEGQDVSSRSITIVNATEFLAYTVGNENNPTDVVNNEITNPYHFKLFQNYPNPFNPSTTIYFQIQDAGIVTLIVYDILGNEVATLVNENKEPGNYNFSFDASSLSSGTYIYQLRMNGFVETKKLIMIK